MLVFYLFLRAWSWRTKFWQKSGILIRKGALLPRVWYSILYYYQSDLLNLHNHESYISASVEKNGREKNPPAYRLSSSVFRNHAPSFPSLRPLGLILLILKMWHGDVCPSWKNVHNHSFVQIIVGSDIRSALSELCFDIYSIDISQNLKNFWPHFLYKSSLDTQLKCLT